MQFHVLTLTAEGNQRALQIDAADAPAARRAAASSGADVLLVTPVRGAAQPAAARRGRFELDLFCQELLAMLRAAVPVREALQTLDDRDRERSGAGVVGGLLQAVEQGRALSAAMAEQPAHFPPLLVESMRAAERTSDYGPALERFVAYRRSVREMRDKLLSATLYPLILLAVSLAVLLFLVGFVVPRFAQVYDDLGDKLSPASRALLAAGQALSAHPLLALAVLAASMALVAIAWRRGGAAALFGGLRRLLPPLERALAGAEMARLYRTLSLLLSGGIPLVTAMDLAAGVLPPGPADRLRAARLQVGEGQAFADSLAAQRLTTLVAERFFRVGERTGRLAEMIDRAAEFHETEVARSADRASRVIGPLMMLLMGALIGLVVVLMYMPIFQLTEVLQ